MEVRTTLKSPRSSSPRGRILLCAKSPIFAASHSATAETAPTTIGESTIRFISWRLEPIDVSLLPRHENTLTRSPQPQQKFGGDFAVAERGLILIETEATEGFVTSPEACPRSGGPVGEGDGESQLHQVPVPSRDNSAGDLALPSVYPQLPRRRRFVRHKVAKTPHKITKLIGGEIARNE